MFKKLIQIDLDGVLNTYNGDYKPNEITPIRDDAFNFLQKLSQNFYIELFTVRDKEICKKWLEENNIAHFFINITDTKNPLAFVYIDDRAINFNGNYDETYNKIIKFKPYWKRK